MAEEEWDEGFLRDLVLGRMDDTLETQRELIQEVLDFGGLPGDWRRSLRDRLWTLTSLIQWPDDPPGTEHL